MKADQDGVKTGSREPDVRIWDRALEVSRLLGLYVFLPLMVVTAIISVVTFSSFLSDMSEGKLSIESYWFFASFSVLLLAIAFFSQRKRIRSVVLLPAGVVFVSAGIFFLWQLCYTLATDAASSVPIDVFVFAPAVVVVFLAVGWSLIRYGRLMWARERKRHKGAETGHRV